MEKEEKKDMKKMMEAAKILAENDPQSFMIIKSNIEVLKIRHDMELVDRNGGQCVEGR